MRRTFTNYSLSQYFNISRSKNEVRQNDFILFGRCLSIFRKFCSKIWSSEGLNQVFIRQHQLPSIEFIPLFPICCLNLPPLSQENPLLSSFTRINFQTSEEEQLAAGLAAVYYYKDENWLSLDGGGVSKVYVFYNRQHDLYRVIGASAADDQVSPIQLLDSLS